MPLRTSLHNAPLNHTSDIPLKSTLSAPLQASRWVKLPVLLDTEEMEALLIALGTYWIVQVGRVLPEGEAIVSPKAFLNLYATYISTLKRGESPSIPSIRPYFSTVWTTSLDLLCQVKIAERQYLAKAERPVIQLQPHRFDYSSADGKFHSMILGEHGISWGIQFSYPHLYQDEQFRIIDVKEETLCPNTPLFKQLQRWIRSHTIAVPFEIMGKKVNVPIRLGKGCVHWINAHPQIQAKGLRVLHS